MAESASIVTRNKPLGDFHETAERIPKLDYSERIKIAATRQAESSIKNVSSGTESKINIHTPSAGIDSTVDPFDVVTDLGFVSNTGPQVTFHALQEWEGYVLNVGSDEFTARLVDLTDFDSKDEEEAVIPICEISNDDVKRLKRGSILRWVIGYENRGGTKRRISQIVFRDLPVLSKKDWDEGVQWAEKVVQIITE